MLDVDIVLEGRILRRKINVGHFTDTFSFNIFATTNVLLYYIIIFIITRKYKIVSITSSLKIICCCKLVTCKHNFKEIGLKSGVITYLWKHYQENHRA